MLRANFRFGLKGVFNITPHYEVVKSEGPDHSKVFTVQVCLGEAVWGVGAGRSKQTAAQEAAQAALLQAEDYEDTLDEPDVFSGDL